MPTMRSLDVKEMLRCIIFVLQCVIVVGASLFVAGCADDLPPASRVSGLRVLAVRAEPPEVESGETATIDALVVLPHGSDGEDAGAPSLSYLWLACRPDPANPVPTGCALSPSQADAASATPFCDAAPEAPLCVVGLTPTVGYRAALAVAPGASAQVYLTLIASDRDAIACAEQAAENDGLPDPAHCVVAVKQLSVAAMGASSGSARNHNPRLATFTIHGEPLGASPVPIPDDAAELPLVAARCPSDAVGTSPPGTPTGACPLGSGPETKADGTVEALTVSWFSTSGVVDPAHAYFQPADCTGDCLRQAPPMSVAGTWTAPDEVEAQMDASDGVVRFWAVVRDDRGGVGWLDGTARAR